jgi:hypothetical protein
MRGLIQAATPKSRATSGTWIVAALAIAGLRDLGRGGGLAPDLRRDGVRRGDAADRDERVDRATRRPAARSCTITNLRSRVM